MADEPSATELESVVNEDKRPLEEILGETMGETFDQMDEAESTVNDEQEATEDAPGEPEEGGETTEEAPETAASETDEQPDDQPGEEGAEETFSPPERWTVEDKETFQALPREAQDLVLKRERDIERHLTQKTQEVSEQRRQYQELDQLYEPRRQQLAAQGLTVAQNVAQLQALADAAQDDPAAFVKWFAESRGLDLSDLEAGAESADPALAATNQRIASLEQRIQNDTQQRQQADAAKGSSLIDAFKKDHEHYDAVESDILAILPRVQEAMPAGTPETWLKESYDRALWANPEVRKLVLEDQEKGRKKAAVERQKAEAAKAKKAAGTNLKPKGAPSGGEKRVKSIEETMGEAYDRVSAA